MTRNNDTVSILQRIILKVRKNTMNKIITVTTFTKEYFCRVTVHFYRGGENTRIKEMCVLQVMYSGSHSLLLKKNALGYILRYKIKIKIHCMESAYQKLVFDLDHRLYFCIFSSTLILTASTYLSRINAIFNVYDIIFFYIHSLIIGVYH